jgi:CRP-like cAMP-binding protein
MQVPIVHLTKRIKIMFKEYVEKQNIDLLIISKNKVLQVPGRSSANAFYVKSGLLRSYKIDDNGKIHILMFAPEGWIISDIESHILSSPSELFIDALEDSEIYKISEFNPASFAQTDKNNLQLIEKLVKRIAVMQRRLLLLMGSTAKQRYEEFLLTYPQLVNRVPLKMIASYLGITPEALSNIRSKMRKQSD